MFGKTNISHVKIWNHPIERTNCTWMFQVPAAIYHLLVVEPSPKDKIGSFPQVRLKIKNDWNYHLGHKPYTYRNWKGDGTVPTYWFIRTLSSSTFWYLCHLFWPEGTWKRWWVPPFFILALHHWLCAHLQQGPWQGLVGQVRRRRPWIAWRTLKKHRVPPCWNGCGLCFLEFGALLPWFFRHASWHM